jgi:hypothetical protein
MNLVMLRSVCTIATSKEPRQIDPKLVVSARIKLALTTDEDAFSWYHQIATAPDVVTWITFVRTVHIQNSDSNRRKYNPPLTFGVKHDEYDTTAVSSQTHAEHEPPPSHDRVVEPILNA